MLRMECGARDAIWIGETVRVALIGPVDGQVVLFVSAHRSVPVAVEASEVKRATGPRDKVVTSIRNRRQADHVVLLTCGRRLRIGEATIGAARTRRAAGKALGAQSAVLEIDAPAGDVVTQETAYPGQANRRN